MFFKAFEKHKAITILYHENTELFILPFNEPMLLEFPRAYSLEINDKVKEGRTALEYHSHFELLPLVPFLLIKCE
jgi:hypothetical protein